MSFQRFAVAALTVLGALLGPVSLPKAQDIDRVTLKNGMRVVLLPIEGSTSISIITHLPLGFLSDDCGKTQWSHLIEHLVSSSTGPAPYDEINAETQGQGMHFDYSRPAASWREGLDHHARWLRIEQFSQEAVEREIGRVIEEMESLDTRKQTGKAAIAAWAQAVRCGAAHVSINEHLGAATPNELHAYYLEKLLQGRPPVMTIVGQIERGALLAELDAKIGSLVLTARAPAEREPSRSEPEVQERVTWDLHTPHVIYYWRLPALEERDSAVVAGATAALTMRWNSGGQDYREKGSFVLVDGDVELEDSRYLIAILNPTDIGEATLARADEHARAVVSEVLSGRSLLAVAKMHLQAPRQQIVQRDKAIAMAVRQGIARRLVEGNLGVLTGQLEFLYEGEYSDVLEHLEREDEDRALSMLSHLLSPERRRRLVIAPRPSPAKDPVR